MTPTGPTSLLLKTVLSGGVALGAMLCAMSPSGAEVGVTAAVNVDARGRPPGGAPRVLALGANIVHNEQVTTDGQGLVQILLLDGTTFTVGPNSDLTIDEFVYNPATGDAKVVASLTKGVFRFVGARTSQTEGGATVKTPVGTIGIRGAVSNVSYDPATGETKASLVAGNGLTITSSDGTTRIVYETGYTAVITKGEGGGTTTTIRKSTPAETRVFQQQLAGKPGKNGGTGNPPTDQTVEDSGVEETNSGLPDTMTPPGSPKPVQSSEPDQVEEIAGIDGKTQDDLDNDIEDELNETQPNARVLMAPGDDTYVTSFGSFPNAGERGLVATDQTLILTPQDDRLVSANGEIDLPDYTGTEGDAGLVEIEVGFDEGDEASFQGNPLSGKAYAGHGDFAAYLLGFDDIEDPYDNPAENPVYVIVGTPTPEGVLIDMETGFDVRRYTLTDDPIQDIPVPFFNNDLYGGYFESGSYNSSDMFVIEPGASTSADMRTFQSWISIEGSGQYQKSAAFLNTSNGYRNNDGELVMSGGRRGSFRYSATDSATNLRGGISTIPGGSGGHFFGPDAEHFVIGTSIDPADTFFDSHHGSGFSNPYAVGYLDDGNFATHHVSDLVDEDLTTTFTRVNGGSDGELKGFMAGMGEGTFGNGTNLYRLTSDGESNLSVSFNALDNAFAARGTVYDANGDDSLDNLLLTFGHYTDEEDNEFTGQGTYIDDTYYGALNNDSASQTRLRTDDDQDIAEAGFGAGSYIVSGRANPIEGYQHFVSENPAYDCSDCDFIQWGWWGTRVQAEVEVDDNPELRTDYVHMGTWVAGELTDPAALASTVAEDLPFGGFAVYQGTALGTVARDGAGQYIAQGDFNLGYDFSARSGEFGLNFDGESVSGIVTDNLLNPTGNFSGGLSGSVNGFASGNFVDDGPNVAAGVIGNFTLGSENMSAVGTFAGLGNNPL